MRGHWGNRGFSVGQERLEALYKLRKRIIEEAKVKRQERMVVESVPGAGV